MENPRLSYELQDRTQQAACETPPRMASPSPERLALSAGSSGELPPVDRGRQAWLFLMSATITEVLVWGMPFSVGILHNYWSRDLFKDQGADTILSLAATLQTGFMYLQAIFVSTFFRSHPHLLKPILVFGTVAGSVGLIGSAFATKPYHLVLTLGICFPFACCLYLPAAILLFDWFVDRRGAASGIMYAGTGAGGAIFPFLMQALLDRFGYKPSMIALGVGFLILGLLSIPFINHRIPVTKATMAAARHQPKGIDFSFLRHSPFWCFAGCIVVTSFSSFLPSIWLPTYAEDVNSRPGGTVLLAVMNAASIPGLLILGWLSDRFSLRLVLGFSCFGATAACAFAWGFAGTSSAALIVFCIVFGFLSLAFPSVWAKCVTIIVRGDPTLPGTIFSLFHFSRGIGNICSGPLSSAILQTRLFKGSVGSYVERGNNNWGALLIYTVVCLVLGSSIGVSYRK